MKKFCLAIFFLSVIHCAYSQENSNKICGTDIQMQKLFEKHPESKKQLELFDINYKSTSKRNTSYILPVVFHVFGTIYNNGTTVTQEIIEDALDRTNEDFKGLTSDFNTVKPQFSTLKGTLDITFKLAKIDPIGNTTPGVVFYNEASGMGNYDSPIVSQVAWDNKKYINIYITRDLYNDGKLNNSGVAWLPSVTMTNQNIARIVYNGSYLGNNTDENFRSVLTHEFGHFLGLHHTFREGCLADTTAGDKVADTPPQGDDSSGEGCFGRINCFSEQINIENFMDYSDCYKMFTKGQVARMIHFLENSDARNTLWTSQNLIDTGLESSLSVSDNQLLGVSLYPNPSKGIFNLKLPSSDKAKIKIYNFLGQTVFQTEKTPINNLLNINLNEFNGVFLLKIKQENKSAYKKIFIE